MDLSNKKPATLSHYEALVLDALRRVAQGLDEALDLESLASPACMAPLHFHRVFRGLIGETPLQLHRRLRLERAAWRLAERQDTVLRIALDAGYDTHESFTRAFREAFGRSPSEHRALARDKPARAPCERAARKLPNRLHAACGLHADYGLTTLPSDLSTLFLHHGVSIMEVEIKTRPALRVAALAHTGPYNTIGSAFDRLGEIAGPAGLLSHNDAQMVAIYLDDPETVPAGQLRSAAGLIVPQLQALPAALHEVLLPAGRWACTLHRGSYQGLGDTWQRLLGQWLPASGHRVRAGDCYEFYLNNPGNASEEQLRTALYVPLLG
jgi:AraC family transcriptional regulator